MNTGHQDEEARQAALNAQQAQAEQDFIAAREQLAAQDAAARQAEQVAAKVQEPPTEAERAEYLPKAEERWRLMDEAEKAAQAPGVVLTREAIEQNPWNAVFMAAPDKELWPLAFEALQRLSRETVADAILYGLTGDDLASDAALDRAHSLAQEMRDNDIERLPSEQAGKAAAGDSIDRDAQATLDDIERRGFVPEAQTAATEHRAGERLNASGFRAEGPLDMPSEQAALFERIRADLDELFTNCEPSELDEIARMAAVQNIEQRTAPGEHVTLQDLQGEPYSDEIRAGLAKPIPEDASLYLVHRVNKATEVELDGMTDRDADPYSREDLEKIAAMDARAYEVGELLHEMTRDRVDEPQRGPDAPGHEGPTSGPRNDDPSPPHGPAGPGDEGVRAAEDKGPDHDPDDPSNGRAAAIQPDTLTLEAIERDPWNAVNLAIPDNADCELLGVIEGAAYALADAKTAAESELLKAEARGQTASARLEELACLSQGDGEHQTEAPEIDAADSFRMGASATTNTEQGQKDRDVAARILALEELTGNEESKAHYAYASTQRSYSERIVSADSPDMREGLQAERFAHSQTYAADLCEQGYIQHGLDGRFEEALLLRQEGNLHREIAEGVTQRGPEATPPGKDTGNVADSMAAAAAEALGPTARAAAVVEGPTPEQQQGQQPAAHEIRGEPGKGDYAALREESAAFEESDERATIANHGLNIRAMMEVSPEGTYIASRPKSDFATRETDYEGGPVRPGFAAVAAALAATQEAVSDERAADEETRIQAADTKAKHEEASGAKAAELHTATSEASNEASSRPLSRAEQARLDAAEYAAGAEREQESGHSMTGAGGGRGGR